MNTTVAHLKKGQKAIIVDFDSDKIPLKLIEMGCLPGNDVEVIQVAPFGDPFILMINDNQLVVRLETAQEIKIELK